MHVIRIDDKYVLYKDKTSDAAPIGHARLADGVFTALEIDAAWRRRGYGSYLLKEVLRQNGAFEKDTATEFTAPPPTTPAAAALFAKYGFAAQSEGGSLCRRHVPDYTAVRLCHDFLTAQQKPGGFYLDATCGNGHDTLFLCKLAGPGGRVIGLDIQKSAVDATNRRLQDTGWETIGCAVQASHADLLNYAAPGTADGIVFNFGWLPGAAHKVHSAAETTLPALQAALTALRPGGVLAAVLYSGREIGDTEKNAALRFFEGLPLQEYTVVICRFANWADTAPLPCFVVKRGG